MASFQLGAIFTDVAGSIAGTTFRRTPRGIIGYNKQRTQIKSAFAKNNVRIKLAQIFSEYRLLDEETKGRWNYLATLYPQLDKFGNTIYLSGRQFFTKLNAQLIPTNTKVDINTFDDRICPLTILSVSGDLTEGEVNIVFDDIAENYFLLVEAYPLRSGSSGKPTKKSVNTFSGRVNNVSQYNIISEFLEQFGEETASGFYGFNIRFMSNSGFKSPLQVFTAEISYL